MEVTDRCRRLRIESGMEIDRMFVESAQGDVQKSYEFGTKPLSAQSQPTILSNMAHPASEHQSVLSSILSRSAAAPQEAFFLIFFSDFDQAKGLMWCPVSLLASHRRKEGHTNLCRPNVGSLNLKDCVDAVPLVEAYQRSNPKHSPSLFLDTLLAQVLT